MKKSISITAMMVLMVSLAMTTSMLAFADDSPSPEDAQTLSSLQKIYKQNQAKKKQLQQLIAQASGEGHQCSADQSSADHVKPDDYFVVGAGSPFVPAATGTGSAGRTFETPAFNLMPDANK
jgi:hypothetical protein